MVRASSTENQYILVCNDNGKVINFPVQVADAKFTFAGKTHDTLDQLIDFLKTNPIASKSGGPAFTLTQPAPGGSAGTHLVNLEESAYAYTSTSSPVLGTDPAKWTSVEAIQWLSYKNHSAFRELFYGMVPTPLVLCIYLSARQSLTIHFLCFSKWI